VDSQKLYGFVKVDPEKIVGNLNVTTPNTMTNDDGF
jgi:hypothetical protein